MLELYPNLLKADVLALVTPLYYHTYTAQLKAVIDRFHAKDKFLCGANKRAILLAVGANPNEWVMMGITATFETSLKYLCGQDKGKVLAFDCIDRTAFELTDCPQKAYPLGLGL